MCFLRPLERATGYEVCCFKIRPVSTGSYDAPMRGTGLYLGGSRVQPSVLWYVPVQNK
jgi:hypothetical protein